MFIVASYEESLKRLEGYCYHSAFTLRKSGQSKTPEQQLIDQAKADAYFEVIGIIKMILEDGGRFPVLSSKKLIPHN